MDARFEFLTRMGDSCLVLSQRVSAWCGHAPVIEEDIAMSNMALDLLGQAQLWLALAGEQEDKGRTADDLAYLRDAWDYRNLLLTERPNGDYGQTLVRQFLFDAWHHLVLDALAGSSDQRIAEIAAKASREVAYHIERSRDLVVRLADGTAESKARIQSALDTLWPYVGEMFADDAVDATLAGQGVAPLPSSLRDGWEAIVTSVLREGGLERPGDDFAQLGGKTGRHSEHLGYILAEMQFLQRTYPGATW
ncbi:MAG: 1,2-phenylacetyl-CoA epoxidase subunit PaaC [Nitratireductor sp.]